MGGGRGGGVPNSLGHETNNWVHKANFCFLAGRVPTSFLLVIVCCWLLPLRCLASTTPSGWSLTVFLHVLLPLFQTLLLTSQRPAKYQGAGPLVLILGYNHRITEAGQHHWSSARSNRASWSRLLRAVSSLVSKISRGGDSTTSLSFCASVWPLSQWNVFLLAFISVCVHCLLFSKWVSLRRAHLSLLYSLLSEIYMYWDPPKPSLP